MLGTQAPNCTKFPFLIQRDWSSKSDVWSFGVTVWEIFALCSARPYPDLDDDDVEDRLLAAASAAAAAENDDSATATELFAAAAMVPPELPAEARALVATCFACAAGDRPSFGELQRAFANAVSKSATVLR